MEEKQELKRTLKKRHLDMIAIGGAIGTGLFLASGTSVATAGPGGALVAYACIGAMVYFLMTSLGEMATYLPVSGSFETYATRFVDPALGFAMGWNYWYSWAVTVPSEMVAGAIIMKYWFPNVPGEIWSLLFLVLLVGLNIMGARMYGEAEFWFAGIKVATIIIFIVVGILMIIGILKGGPRGEMFMHWTQGDAPFHGGVMTIFSIAMIAGFSFQGTEIVGIAAGESENPEKNVPRAIKTVFWRILLFYIGAIAIISFIIPYNDPNLLQGGAVDNVAMSPFTLVLQRTGFAAAASVMNAVILTSVLSCGNSALYTSTRMIYALAKEGKAPKFLAKVNRHGVPSNALIFTAVIALLAFGSYLVGENSIYLWLINASGLCGFITWLGIAISHWRFRRAWVAQGHEVKELKYHAMWFPFGPIFAFLLCFIVIVFQDPGSVIHGRWLEALSIYIGVILFFIFFIPYKIKNKTKMIPLTEVDLSRSKVTGMDDFVNDIEKE